MQAAFRRSSVIYPIVALAAAGAMLALALVVAPRGEGASTNRQFRAPAGFIAPVASNVERQQTRRARFERIRLFTPVCGVIARGPISATLSMQLRGAPATIRMRIKRSGKRARTMKPGVVRFDPGQGSNSFSFTFIGHLGRRTTNTGLDFRAEWRSPTGETAILEKATLRSSLRLVGRCDRRD
jgi:hypothetical protein